MTRSHINIQLTRKNLESYYELKMRIPSHSVSKLARSFFIAHFVDLQNSLHDDEIFFHRLVHI